MAIDYDVGRRDLGQLYGRLLEALKNKGDAVNRRKAEDIERQGILGTGIRSSQIGDLVNTGMAFAEFGEGRKERKISRATKSFEARMNQARDRIIELRRFGDEDSINEIRFIQAGMAEERNRFENLMSDYEDTSLWDSGLGGKGVGYKDTGELSSLAEKYMKSQSDKRIERAKQDAILDNDARRQQGQLTDSGYGIKGHSGMRDFPEPSREDYQPDTYGPPLPTHGLQRKRRRDLSGIGENPPSMGGFTGSQSMGPRTTDDLMRERENKEAFATNLRDLGGEYQNEGIMDKHLRRYFNNLT